MTEAIKVVLLGGVVNAVLTVVVSAVGTLTGWSKLRKFIEDHKEKYSMNYFNLINSKDFISFRDEVLKRYYAGFLTNINGRDFLVHTFEGEHYCYPFRELYNVDELEFDTKNEYIKKDYKKHKYYKKYKKSLYKRAKYPDKGCFMLNELTFDDKKQRVCHFSAWVGIYADNDYTSQILEYELYTLFKKYKEFDLNKYVHIY